MSDEILKKKIYFCFGSGHLTDKEFETHYIPQLQQIFLTEENYEFIMGDYKGADKLCFLYINYYWSHNKKTPKITVYHMFDKPRFKVGQTAHIKTIGGFSSDEERDTAMTKDSTHDIYWIKDLRDIVPNYDPNRKSGTEKNIIRRQVYNKLKINQRPSWDNTFMDICETIANRSTCLRLKTAAILVKNNNIISIGYNGSCSGKTHCNEYWLNEFKSNNTVELTDSNGFEDFIKSDKFYTEHHKWANLNELHAEMNCITNAAKNNLSSENSTMYTLYSPCRNCSKIIISSGIKKIIYKYLYKRDTSGIEFLNENSIYAVKLS
jgi:dCMP deaminase